MTALAVALSLLPAPHDYLEARAELDSPADSLPVVVEPTARTQFALLHLMVREGACDPDAVEAWFGGRDYGSEVWHARRLWASVRDCPQLWEGEWVPGPAYLQGRAAFWSGRAERWRELAVWEADREAECEEYGRRADSLAAALSGVAGSGWCRPRRHLLRDVRMAVGAEGWAMRELPAGW